MDITESKIKLRKKMGDERNALSSDVLRTSSNIIFQKIKNEGLLDGVKDILTYVNFRSEVITIEFISYLLEAKNTNVYVPYTSKDSMTFYRINSLSELSEGYMGILEPSIINHERQFQSMNASTCLCITPGLAYDIEGNRLGYGGGYYDRFFDSRPDIRRIGVCFDFQINDSIIHEEHDHLMDYIISEKRLLYFNNLKR